MSKLAALRFVNRDGVGQLEVLIDAESSILEVVESKVGLTLELDLDCLHRPLLTVPPRLIVRCRKLARDDAQLSVERRALTLLFRAAVVRAQLALVSDLHHLVHRCDLFTSE